MKIHKLFFLIFASTLCLGTPQKTLGQIQIGGLADFELRMGEEDSSPYVNETPTDGLSLYTPYVRLFINSGISEKWFVNSVLQADYYNSKSLNNPFFSVLNLNYTPDAESNLTFTAGRFVTPYGTYSKRILSSQNPFVHLPLTHASGLPVSKRLGFLSYEYSDSQIPREAYPEGDTGLTMVYQRMYTQGLKVSGTVGEDQWLNYNIAATLAPASSHFEYAEYDTPAIIGRVILRPAVWAELGVSYSSGAFMKEDSAYDSLQANDLSSYDQNLFGADLTFSYRYYTLIFEYNHSTWEAPLYNENESLPSAEASVSHFSSEFIVDFPFLVGGYAGLRYEQLNSGNISTYQQWTYDRERIEIVYGHKLDRNVTLKTSYLISNDDGPGLKDNVFALQLSVLF
ncbi:hypothetical protein [Gracilimonas sp.]|uniref:hypothetical protein n=1 Tax=Gracilimonas sp. TaxID=1974203 RepID=UPI0028719CB3|nr:hypothetical protein [Gracilimonas sp.]